MSFRFRFGQPLDRSRHGFTKYLSVVASRGSNGEVDKLICARFIGVS
jgi:hypothetical protein